MQKTPVGGKAAVSESPETLKQRQLGAQEIVSRHVLISMGAGVIPIPGVDMVAISATNLNMVRELSEHYQLPFTQSTAKNIISSVLGGATSTLVGRGLVFSLLKFVPIVGSFAGATAVPITAGALTNVLGKMFVEHFETGGSLIDFNLSGMRDYLRNELEKSRIELEKSKAELERSKAALAKAPSHN